MVIVCNAYLINRATNTEQIIWSGSVKRTTIIGCFYQKHRKQNTCDIHIMVMMHLHPKLLFLFLSIPLHLSVNALLLCVQEKYDFQIFDISHKTCSIDMFHLLKQIPQCKLCVVVIHWLKT